MNTMNQSRKPQESLFASTKHDVVQSISRNAKTDDETFLDILEKIRKTPTTDDSIQKSIFPDYEKDSTTKPLDYGKLSKRSINQPRKPQKSFLASTKHDVVQSTSRKAKTDDETFLDILEKIRKTPTTHDLIQKSIFPDYEKDSTTKPLDYGKLSKRSINQPRKPQKSFLASTKHDVVQSTSRKAKTDDETFLDILEKIRKMPTTHDLIQKSIFPDYEKDSTTKPLDYGKLSKRSINQPRKPQKSFLASTKHDVVQSTSRKAKTDDETFLDILEKIRKTPTTHDLIQKSIFPDYEKDSTTKPLDYGKLSKRSINQPRKPQKSFLASTKHDVVQSTSRKAKTDDETFLDILEKIRKTPTTHDLIQKSIFPDYEKDSTTKPLDYGKLSKHSINQPRKPQESFLASTKHDVVQSISRKDETDDETIWDICEKIKNMPKITDLIQKSIFSVDEKDYEEDSTEFYLVSNNIFYPVYDFYDYDDFF